MKLEFRDAVVIKSGFYKGKKATVKVEAGIWPLKMYMCTNESYGSAEFFAAGFWWWQLQKVQK